MDKLAIVILNFNGENYLKKFIPLFIAHSNNHPIYVVDNASNDGSLEYLKNSHPTVRIIALEKNYGFTSGYNLALSQIKSEYYAIVNSDIEVTPGWTEPLLSFMDSNETYFSCQPKIKSFFKRAYFEYAGACGGFIDAFGFPYCRGRIFDHLEEDSNQYETTQPIFWSSGACMVVRASLFHHLDGFDDDFFAHMEEIDLCWRAHHLGYQVASVPQSIVYHVGGGTLSVINPKKTYLNFRNGLSLLIKNLPFSEFWKIPIRICLDWVAAFKFLLDFAPKHSIAVFKAHAHSILRFRRNLKKRSKVIKPIDQANINYQISIVIDRYLLGKKKFSDL